MEEASVIVVGEPVAFAQTPSRLVKEGHVFYEYGLRTKATVEVDRYLKGSGPSTIEVLSDYCVESISPGAIGLRHILFLQYDPQGGKEPTASGCLGSGPLIGPLATIHPAEVGVLTGPGEAPDDALDEPVPPGADGIPLGVLAAVGIALPVAFLLASAFLWPRRR